MPQDERDRQEKPAAGASRAAREDAARGERPRTERTPPGAAGERRAEERPEGDLSSADWGE